MKSASCSRSLEECGLCLSRWEASRHPIQRTRVCDRNQTDQYRATYSWADRSGWHKGRPAPVKELWPPLDRAMYPLTLNMCNSLSPLEFWKCSVEWSLAESYIPRCRSCSLRGYRYIPESGGVNWVPENCLGCCWPGSDHHRQTDGSHALRHTQAWRRLFCRSSVPS